MIRLRSLLLLIANGVTLYLFLVLRLHCGLLHQEQQPTQPPPKSQHQRFFPGDYVHFGSLDTIRSSSANFLTSNRSHNSVDAGSPSSSSFGAVSLQQPSPGKATTERAKYIEQVGNRIRYMKQRARVVGPIREQLLDLGFQNNPHDGRPAYSDIVNESGTLTRDVSELLQFAVLGFGKCGTTTMMDWISSHPKMQCFPEEVLDLMKYRPGALLAKMYALPAGEDVHRGYKSPNDISMQHVMQQLATIFPKTKLIIGLRHPVRWFESLYNFRVQNFNSQGQNQPFPPPHKLVGTCKAGTFATCTAKGEFAIFLRNLGLTPTPTGNASSHDKWTKVIEFERLMHKAAGLKYLDTSPIPNPVFLFEIRQLQETNATLQQSFQSDVSNFLGLPASDPLPLQPPHSKPGRVNGIDTQIQAAKDSAKIDICRDKYVKLRRVLMRQARTTSVWLRDILLPTGRVRISSPDHFNALLQDWMHDPCGPNPVTDTAGAEILKVWAEQTK